MATSSSHRDSSMDNAALVSSAPYVQTSFDMPAPSSGKIGVKFDTEGDRKENVDPSTCPIRVLYEHEKLYRVALMSVIKQHKPAIKFYEIVYGGTLPEVALTTIPPSHTLRGMEYLIKNVLEAGFERVSFNNRLYTYVLCFNPDIEQFLVDRGNQALGNFNREFVHTGVPAVTFHFSWIRRIARNVLKILNQFCERNFYNGPSIQMANACMDLGTLLNECSGYHPNGFRQCAEPLGGAAHGSNYNTRVAYMTCVGHTEYIEYENVLEPYEYIYYDRPIFNMMEDYLQQGFKCPSTTFTHDFGTTYASLLTIVGECKSGSIDAEELKVTLGCCRILNYSPIAFGILFTEQFVRVYKLIRRDDAGEIVVRHLEYTYCERARARNVHGHIMRPPKDRTQYRKGIETVILLLAQVEAEMEPKIDGITAYAGEWDYAAARHSMWHGGDVELKYYEIYKGKLFQSSYPEEMQRAVEMGAEAFYNAQAMAQQEDIDVSQLQDFEGGSDSTDESL